MEKKEGSKTPLFLFDVKPFPVKIVLGSLSEIGES
jgi:hypothetical protein